MIFAAHPIRAVLLAVFFLGPTCWAQTDGSPAANPPTSRASAAVLRIDGHDISAEEYVTWLIENMGDRHARVFALEDFVVDREARRVGVDVPDAAIAAHVGAEIDERVRGAFFGREEEWSKELARTGRTEAGVRRLRAVEAKPFLQAKAIASIDRVVPEETVRRAFEARFGRKGRKYDLLMLKLEVALPTSTEDVAELKVERERVMNAVRARALALRARVVAGEDFGKIAREASEDPDTRDRRGVPSGGFSHPGWPHNFMAALEKLAPGEISEPLYARGGFWLVKLRSVTVTPLDSVRKELEAELLAAGPESDEIATVLKRLQANVQVKVLPGMHAPPTDGERPPALEPAISIDGDLVTRGEFARWLVDSEGEVAVPRFVEEWVVARKARELGIQVTDEEVEARTHAYVQWMIDTGYKKSREAWLAFLAVNHRTEDSFMRDISGRMRVDALAEKLVMQGRQPTPAEVKSRFGEVYGADGERIEARWIVLFIRTGEPDPAATREELEALMRRAAETTRARAVEVVAQLRAGADFAELAKVASDDERTRALGGLLPGRFRGDVYSAEIEAAVRGLKVGEVTDPLLYGSTYVVFQCASRRKVTFDEVENELLQELRTLKPTGTDLASFRNSLVKPLDVEILPAMFE